MKDTFSITKSVEIDYGHRLEKHDSKCHNIHGHRAKIDVTVSGPLVDTGSAEGMVVDFGAVRKIIDDEIVARLDHKLIIGVRDRDFFYALELKAPEFCDSDDPATAGWYQEIVVRGIGKIVVIEDSPTAEVLAQLSYNILAEKLDNQRTGVWVVRVTWWETPSCRASFPGEVVY